MKFADWKKEILGLNRFEEEEKEKILGSTLPKRIELLKEVQRDWLCEATGSMVCMNGNGLIERGEPNVWIKKSNGEPVRFVNELEPEELELVAKVKRALVAWVKGETDTIVVDAPEVEREKAGG